MTSQGPISNHPLLQQGGREPAKGKGALPGSPAWALSRWSAERWIQPRSKCCRKTNRWETCSEEGILKSKFSTLQECQHL